MKRAEIIGGVLMMGLSVYTAWLSAENTIGWASGRGPGAGFFPFWLSIIMLVCATIITIKASLGVIPERWKDEEYWESKEARGVYWHIFSLVVALGIVPLVGVYGGVIFLILFHMKFLGKDTNSWLATILTTILFPIGIFLFFEIMMQVILPKGMLEPLYDPIFGFFAAS